MKKWSIPVMVAIVALLMPMSSAYVEAQEQAKQEMLRQGDRISGVNSDNVTLTKAEILKLNGVPGKGIDKAPGLQKPFNPKSQAAKRIANTDNVTLTKAEILKLRGVPGKGIEKAPGLQKPFNPKSQDAKHAGKKDRALQEEQLRIRQSTENHGDAQGQMNIKQKVKNHQ